MYTIISGRIRSRANPLMVSGQYLNILKENSINARVVLPEGLDLTRKRRRLTVVKK